MSFLITNIVPTRHTHPHPVRLSNRSIDGRKTAAHQLINPNSTCSLVRPANRPTTKTIDAESFPFHLHHPLIAGKNEAPLYQYLKSKQGGFLGSDIKWNFSKFLIDQNGIVSVGC